MSKENNAAILEISTDKETAAVLDSKEIIDDLPVQTEISSFDSKDVSCRLQRCVNITQRVQTVCCTV